MTTSRAWLTLLVIAACADETPEDHVQDLLASAVVCGHLHDTDVLTTSCRAADVPPEQIVQCMTDALAQGTLAVTVWYKEDAQLWGYSENAFAIDGAIKVYDYYSGMWKGGDGPHLAAEFSCAGPFRATSFKCPFSGVTIPTVQLDGCPY